MMAKDTYAIPSVHPHARGDHDLLPTFERLADGSPPRPWGPRRRACSPAASARFTPTPVGTTRALSHRAARPSVHPHARGDHDVWEMSRYRYGGSPPRPWGPRNPIITHTWTGRFTPTPVGTTRDDEPVLRHCRFTPTPVGTTPRSAPAPPDAPVHPHARGDHAGAIPTIATITGSPPRPWGPHALAVARHREHRFTPTPVGTTWSLSPRLHRGPVHPHARGDHGGAAATNPYIDGSPPRPWGPRRWRPEDR